MPISEISEIATRFNLDGRFESANRYGNGHINDTFIVTVAGSRSRYILQRINKRVFSDPPALMENIRRITEHLQDKDLGSRECLTLATTDDGDHYLVDDEQEYWRAYRFVEGARTYDNVENALQSREAAAIIGEFQNLVCDLPGPRLHETIADFHNTPARYRQFHAALGQDSHGRAGLCSAEIDRALSFEDGAGVLVALQDAGNLPERVTHNDAKLNNVLFDESGGHAICVIDLDTVMPGLALYDFGDLVRSATTSASEDATAVTDVGMRLDYFEALAEGYLRAAINFLTETEIRHLPVAGKVITVEIGLRFLTDYLSGDEYFRVQRPEQNLDRCRAQFALAASFDQHLGDMQRVVAGLVSGMKRATQAG